MFPADTNNVTSPQNFRWTQLEENPASNLDQTLILNSGGSDLSLCGFGMLTVTVFLSLLFSPLPNFGQLLPSVKRKESSFHFANNASVSASAASSD